VGLSSSKSLKFEFLVNKFAAKGQSPLSDFYKIRRGDGVPGPYPHAKLHGCGFKNVGLQELKSPKLVILV